MFLECRKQGLQCQRQFPINVFYDELRVGSYYADLLIEENVIVELKAAEAICEEHELQLVNYLKATHVEVGLLLNFGKTPQFRRKVFTNKYKNLNQS
jgi:GxxExxY protein